VVVAHVGEVAVVAELLAGGDVADVHLDPRHPAGGQRVAKRHLAKAVADPALRAKLTPGYTMGCKRILLSDDYYPAVAQPNVELVTDAIAEVRLASLTWIRVSPKRTTSS